MGRLRRSTARRIGSRNVGEGRTWFACGVGRVALALGATSVFLSARGVRADEKVECARSAEGAQHLRAASSLLEASVELRACARESCPPVVRADCARWLAEVESSIPSVVIHARDAGGHDVDAVRVVVDGQVVAQTLDGQPIALNPGERLFEYVHAGDPPVRERVVLATGEKNRPLSVAFPSAARASAPPARLVASPPPPPHSARPSPLVVALGGGTLVALGSFVYFGATGKSELDALQARCLGHCAASDVDRAWTKLVVADISLGIAAIGAGFATWAYVASRVHVAPVARGAVVGFSSAF